MLIYFHLKSNNKFQSIIVCGVNGTGKTTTIGKLSKILKDNNKKVIVGACDTFRAAAIEQLEKVCEKSNIEVFKSNEGVDPASVAYKTMEYALSNKFNKNSSNNPNDLDSLINHFIVQGN